MILNSLLKEVGSFPFNIIPFNPPKASFLLQFILIFIIVKGRKHAYMNELIKDRRKDLNDYGKDPYVNPINENKRFLKDLSIYLNKGFKHQFQYFEDVNGEPGSAMFNKKFNHRARSVDHNGNQQSLRKSAFYNKVSFLQYFLYL